MYRTEARKLCACIGTLGFKKPVLVCRGVDSFFSKWVKHLHDISDFMLTLQGREGESNKCIGAARWDCH